MIAIFHDAAQKSEAAMLDMLGGFSLKPDAVLYVRPPAGHSGVDVLSPDIKPVYKEALKAAKLK